MTEHISKPHKRITTTLGIAIAAALSPSGKIISSAVAAGVVAVSVTGSAIHENKPPPRQIQASVAASGTPAYQRDAGPLPLVYTEIESEGHAVHVLLTSGSDASGSHGSAPSLRVTGGPIGGAGKPKNGFPGVGPTFGTPRPHPNAPVSLPPRPGFPPVNEIPQYTPPVIEEINCRLEKNKPLKVCETKKTDTNENGSEAEEQKSDDEKTDKDASNPSTHPNDEAASPSNPGSIPPFTAPDVGPGTNAPDTGTGTPLVEEHSQPNVPLLDKLLTDEFDGDGVTPPGEAESKNPGNNGGGADDQVEQAQSFSALELIPTSVPEPSLISLMFLGVAAMAWTGRRRTEKPTRV